MKMMRLPRSASLLVATLIQLFSFAAAADDLPVITSEQIKVAEANLQNVIRTGDTGAGQKYCGALINTSGIRLFISPENRTALIYPSAGGVEKGREAAGLIIQSQTMPMKNEVSQTLKMYGITGRVSDQTVVYQINQRESTGINTTFAVIAFYINENGDLDRNNSILLLTDKSNGTFFVGTSKTCNP